MNRLTKPLARLGTLAVIAGTVLGTPLALGTANASIINQISAYGTVTTNANAALHATYTGHGAIRVDATTGDAIEVDLLGGSAYFVNPQAGGVTRVSNTKVTFTGTGALLDLPVGDAAADGVPYAIIDHTTNTEFDGTLNFSGLSFAGCPATGIDGTGASDTERCVTQGQTAHVLNVTIHYGAGGAGFGAQNLEADLDNSAAGAKFAAAQPAGSGYYNDSTARCTTDASGNCTFAVLDNSPTAVTNPPTVDVNHISIVTFGSTGTIGDGGYPPIPSTLTPQETIHYVATSITSTRVDLIRSTVIAPSSQGTASVDSASGSYEGNAEPGDVVQNVYRVYGGCDPTAATANTNCTGEPLAGISAALTVSDGFFTPNCSSATGNDPLKIEASDNNYANCSFTTAPAVGGQVGAISSSLGQSLTVTTNPNGYIVVSFGIGRDTKFDNNGYVTAAVKVNAVTAETPGNDFKPSSSHCDGGDILDPQSNTALTLGSTPALFSGDKGCNVDFEWTTDETPLNGGTAKLVAIPRVTNPTNNFVNTENNYTATDSGTSNLPDVGRLVYLIHATDQFGNLTSVDDASDADGLGLSKTGVGSAWFCQDIATSSTGQDFTATNPCTGEFGDYFDPTTQNADGTIDQSEGVEGSYTDGFAQQRFQSDASPTAADGMVGCYAASGANLLGLPTGLCDISLISLLGGGFNEQVPGQNFIGVDDGTQTVTLDWTAPTTTFKTFHAAGGGTGASATYQVGNATDAPDVYKLNIYNQLSAPVVTFAATPGNSVTTSTAVTVTGTVVDQFGNGIVGWNVQFVRSGANESSCTPIQNSANEVEATNQAGVAGYTFSCDAAGVANVSIVVTGPGNTQLASGREAVTFLGSSVKVKVEKPTISAVSHKSGQLSIRIVTHPSLSHVRVNIYNKVNGLYRKIGSTETKTDGNKIRTIKGLPKGHHYRIAVKTVNLGAGYHSKYSKSKAPVVKA